jgi:NTE family protein
MKSGAHGWRVWRSGGSLASACAFAMACCAALAAEPGTDTPSLETPERPRIGLVLSGGGAKGGAHAGVLQVLEELRVPIDCIAGTSVGAMIGAGYASGHTATEVRDFVLAVDWPALVSGARHREMVPIERNLADAGFSHEFELGVRDRKVLLPAAAMPVHDLDQLLRYFVRSTRTITDFDRLPIPFRAVATDLVSGNMVVLDSGDLATAVRASMSVPGGFQPVRAGEQMLADGGLTRNLPVDIVRELCADVVIAVTVLEAEVTPEQLNTAPQLATRAINLMVDANTFEQQRTLTARDVNLTIRTADITTPDVERVAETVPMGEAAARAIADRLREFSLPPGQYAAWRTAVTAQQEQRVRLAGVRFDGLQRVNPAFLAATAHVRAGDEVDIARLNREALRLYEIGEFDLVDYTLEGDPAAPTLVWRPREKPWGPDYFVADIGLYASRRETPEFVVYGRHTRSWLNPRGGAWRNEAQLGVDSLVSTSLYQPIDVAQRFFVEPMVGYRVNWTNIYGDGAILATYRLIDLVAGMDFGINFGRDTQARLGYGRTRRDFDRTSGAMLLPAEDARDAVLWISLVSDDQDSARLPTRGIATRARLQWSDESLGANRDWRRLEAATSIAVPLRGDVLLVRLAGGHDLGSELPLDRAFAIGGPDNFAGLPLNALRTPRYWAASTTYLRRVRDLWPAFDQALYIGTRLQGGWFADDFGLLTDEHVYALSLFATRKTFLGPVTLGVAAITDEGWGMWLAFGRYIGRDASGRGGIH